MDSLIKGLEISKINHRVTTRMLKIGSYEISNKLPAQAYRTNKSFSCAHHLSSDILKSNIHLSCPTKEETRRQTKIAYEDHNSPTLREAISYIEVVLISL